MISKQDKINLSNDLKYFCLALNLDTTKEVINALIRFLSEDYDYLDIKNAIKKYTATARVFPKPVDLIELINPKATREDADYLAGRAIYCIREFGIYRAKDAMNHMGLEAWNAVQMIGGWAVLCNTPPDELGTLRAQLRNSCLASINQDEIKDREARRISQTQGKLVNFQDTMVLPLQEFEEDIQDEYAKEVRDFDNKKKKVLEDINSYINKK